MSDPNIAEFQAQCHNHSYDRLCGECERLKEVQGPLQNFFYSQLTYKFAITHLELSICFWFRKLGCAKECIFVSLS